MTAFRSTTDAMTDAVTGLKVTGDWTWTSDYRRAFAPTDDPRVVAVIERDEYPSAPDGDLAPAYWATPDYAMSYTPPTHFAYSRFDSDETIISALKRADEMIGHKGWTSETVERYLRIFHDAAVRIIPTQRYRNDDPIVIIDSAEFRALVGIEGGPDKAHLDGEVSELTAYLSGDVFGIGYGVQEGRVIDTSGSIDLDDFEVTIECWGFYGEDYAQESAAAFDYGEPELPSMLDMPVAGA